MQLRGRFGLRDQVADGSDPEGLPVRVVRIRTGPPVPGHCLLDEPAQVVQQEREGHALLRAARVAHERDVRAAARHGRQQVAKAGAARGTDAGIHRSPAGDGRGLPLARHRVFRDRGPDCTNVLVKLGLGGRPARRYAVEGALADLSGEPEADCGQPR